MIALLWCLSAYAAPLDEVRERFGSPAADLSVVERAWRGGAHLIAEQRLHGLPVHGRSLRVSLGASVTQVVGATIAASPVAPRWSAAQAEAVVLGAAQRGGRSTLWRPRSALVWWAAEQPRLAWAVDVGLSAPLATLRVWVDASTGEVIEGRITGHTATGRVYDPSPALAEPTEVELPRLLSSERLDGEYASARSCVDWEISDTLFGTNACHATAAHALPDAAGDYLFEPDPGSTDDPFAEVHAYFHVDRMADWLAERFAFTLGRALVTHVNFPMANAFYGDFDGDGESDLSFGHVEEDGVDFAYDADVVYHEFGHAVIDRLAPSLPSVQADDYGMEWVAGAVHEGGADVWSMLQTLDPLTGEYAGSAFDRLAIRDLSPDLRCPDHLQGEVHADGKVLGAFGWNLIDDPAVGPDLTAELLYGAIPRWGERLTWPDVGASFLDSAADLLAAGAMDEAAHDAVLQHLEASNLLDCGRVIDLDQAELPTLFLTNGGLYEDLAEIPAGVQLSLARDPTVRAYRLGVRMTGDEGVVWALYGRVGEPVQHRPTQLAALGLAFATADVYDWRLEGDREGDVLLPLDGWDPGETLYLAFASRNLGTIQLLDFQVGRASLTLDRLPLEEEQPRGGCACTHGGAGGGWALLGLVWGLRRRARR
jgi:uncharacterized protein (TIGR03382 family)